MATHTYRVPDMSCDHCKSKVEAKLAEVGGVESVTVDLDGKLVSVTGGDDDALRLAIDEAGYTAEPR